MGRNKCVDAVYEKGWRNGVQYLVVSYSNNGGLGYTARVNVYDIGYYDTVSIVHGDPLTIDSQTYKMEISGFYYGTTISDNSLLRSITITSPYNANFDHANFQGCTNLNEIIFTNKVWYYGNAVFANPDNITVRANAYDEELETWQGHVKCATTNPNLTQNDVGYYNNNNKVYVCQINGATSVVIPATVNSSNVTYYGAPDVDVTNPDIIKNLTFEGKITINQKSFKLLSALENVSFNGSCYILKGAFTENNNLKTITFLGSMPQISGSASEYFAHPENVTILIGHDMGVTPAQLHYDAFWGAFKNIAYYDEWAGEQRELTITATHSNRPVELWQGSNKLGSIPTSGGYIKINWDGADDLVLRVPSQYLERILLDGYDIAPLLSSTTSTDTGYEGYKDYALDSQYLQAQTVYLQVKFSDDTPILFETQSMMFTIDGGPGTANVTIDYADGTSESFDMEHDGESATYHPLNVYSTTQSGTMYAATKGITKIVVRAHPATDEFALTLFDAGKVNQTQAESGEAQNYTAENDGSGTYTYTLLGQKMTASYVRLTFPGTQQNDVKTTIAVNGNYQVKYFFYDFDMEYDYSNVKVSDDYLHGTTTVSHNGTPDSYGSIFIYAENQGQNPNFRVILNGEVVECGDGVEDILRWTGDETSMYDTYMNNTVPDYQHVPCYTLSLSDDLMGSDSWIIIDDGTTPLDQIVSPFQVAQTASVIGDGILSLRNSEGAEVASVSEDAPATISWPKGDDLTLAVTLPDGADVANYEAFLFIDGTSSALQKVDGTAFAPYSMGSINTAHDIILVIRQTGGFETTGITWTAKVTGAINEQTNVGSLINGGDVLDMGFLGLEATQESATFNPADINAGDWAVWIVVKQGQKVRLLFNGDDVTDLLKTDDSYPDERISYSLNETIADLNQFLVDGLWVFEVKDPEITWTALAAGDVAEGIANGGIGVHLMGEGDVELIDINLAPTLTCDTWRNVGIPSANRLSVFAWCQPGYEVTSVTFNGNEYIDSFEQSSDGTCYEFNCNDDLSPFLVDGTWVVIIKKEGSETLTQHIQLIGERLGTVLVQYIDKDGLSYDDCQADYVDPTATFTTDGKEDIKGAEVYVKVPQEYVFKAYFNGTVITNAFNLDKIEDGMAKYSAEQPALDQSLAVTDGVWTFEFTKKGVTWSAVAAGDVVGGNSLSASTFESELEVGVNKNHLFDSMTYEGDERTLALNAYIYVRKNSNFQVWFNGVECTDKFTEGETLSDGTCKWAFNSNDPTVVAPYAVDGTWVVIFYDDKAKYDVNGDGTISIADVTKLVNVILGKE